MQITEIIQYSTVLLSSSGLTYFLTLRTQQRKMANQVATEAFDSVEDIVTRFNAKLAELTEKITALTIRNAELEALVRQLEQTIKELHEAAATTTKRT